MRGLVEILVGTAAPAPLRRFPRWEDIVSAAARPGTGGRRKPGQNRVVVRLVGCRRDEQHCAIWADPGLLEPARHGVRVQLAVADVLVPGLDLPRSSRLSGAQEVTPARCSAAAPRRIK